MSIVIINPNSTSAMTDAMVNVARISAPGLQFEGWTSGDGPPAIQGAEDGEIATPPLLRLVREATGKGADGIIIGCFDDTALVEASRIANCPVLGIGQAAYFYAALRNWKFSVVTTLRISVPVIEENIRHLGLSDHLARVRASDVAVLELESNVEEAERKILAEAMCAERDDGIDAVILGCAGMVNVMESMRRSLAVHVIDPVSTAATCMGWMLPLEARAAEKGKQESPLSLYPE
ncbi:MAG: aspartate/glutamate racemase family protein [Roseobacter sp.]